MYDVSMVSTLNGTSSYSSRKMASWPLEMSRSVSLNAYGMFQPRGPNFLLSCAHEWKKESANLRGRGG
jgi:hypothetical protein